jgi:hypothetical protein
MNLIAVGRLFVTSGFASLPIDDKLARRGLQATANPYKIMG